MANNSIEEKCGNCTHAKSEHSIGSAEYIEGMPDSSCYWDDEDEVCECRQYRPQPEVVERPDGSLEMTEDNEAKALEDARACLEGFGIRLAAEAKSTATSRGMVRLRS